jgi:hypothetical protein
MNWQRVLSQASLTQAELRDAYRSALEASPAIASVVEVADSPLLLDVRTRGGKPVRVDLERLYHDVMRSPPERRAKRFEDQVAATLETARAADGDLPAPTRDQLIPTIKSLAWVGGAPSGLAAAGFVADLAVVYAWDRTSTLVYAQLADLQQLGISIDDAQPIALANLRKRLPRELSTRGDGKSFLFTAGGNIEASLILLPEIWDGLTKQLAGDIIACALARDVLLVTATGIPGGIESLTSARDRIRTSMPPADLISTTLLVRRRGIWEPLGQN